MTQRLRALSTFIEDPSSVPSSHAASSYLELQFQEI